MVSSYLIRPLFWITCEPLCNFPISSMHSSVSQGLKAWEPNFQIKFHHWEALLGDLEDSLEIILFSEKPNYLFFLWQRQMEAWLQETVGPTMVVLYQTHPPLSATGSGGFLKLLQNPNSGELAGTKGLWWPSLTSILLLSSQINQGVSPAGNSCPGFCLPDQNHCQHDSCC